MKKVLFIALALAVGMIGFAQKANQAYKSMTVTCPKPSPVMIKDGAQTPGQQFNLPEHRTFTPQRDTQLEESCVMTTNYDLQSNSALGNRIATWADGTASFVATWDHSGNTSYPERGTGYNYYDGTSFGDMPIERVEPIRSGWPSIAACGNGEILVSHASGTNVYYRSTKGQGEWTMVTNFPDATWPRVICSGPNDQYVHIVAADQLMNDDGIYINTIYYARSTDGGQTWSDMVEFPNLDNSEYGEYRNQLSADDYVMASNGNNVAVLFGSYNTDVFYMISHDNGLTWERQIVAPFPMEGAHAYVFADYPYGMEYAVNTSDNSHSITIDDNGVVHVAFALFHWQASDDNNFTYWPAYGYGIVYWNSEYVNEQGGHEIPLFGDFSGDAYHYDWAEEGGGLGYSLIPDRITELAEADGHQHLHLFGYIDENGDGVTSYENTNPGWMYRSRGLATLPGISVDDQGCVAIIYTVWSETRICAETGYSYRSAYVTCKDAFGTWFDDAINLSSGFMHEQDEVYSTFAAPKAYNGSFWMGYFADDIQGLYMDSNSQYDLTDNYLYAVKVTPDMEGWGVVKQHITATANPTGYGYVSGSGWYSEGALCTLNAFPNPGYIFSNWTLNGTVVSTEPQYSFTVTEEANYVANFIVDPVSFVVTASANPTEGGIIIGAGTYTRNTTCTLSARANNGYFFYNWTNAAGEIVTFESEFSFVVTEDITYIANFMVSPAHDTDYTTYDWQSNKGAITRTINWPDGKVSFAYTMATEESLYDRGTGITTYDPATDTWTNSGGRIEDERTGFGSIARYGQNGIVVAAHTASDTRVYIIPDKDNIEAYSLSPTAILDNTYDISWPNVMTSGPNRNIIHVVATAYDHISIPGMEDVYQPTLYFRSQDGGQTWDKQNVVLPFMTAEYGLSWESNCCYWMETTDDNCLALVVNNPWSDGMVIYSYDNGETWERKVFYQHPDPFSYYDDMLVYPRWTSCQWDSEHNLHVLYEFNGITGDPGSSNFYPGDGGVAYWSEVMPYNASGTTQSAIAGNLTPGQPFVMDVDYLRQDIRNSWWMWSDASHEMWPEYIGYLAPLTDQGDPEDPYNATGFNIYDRSMHGSYNSGVCAFPVLCTVPNTNHLVAVWSALDENHTDMYGNHFYKLFASYSDNGGLRWTPMIQLTKYPVFNDNEFVYNQATVVGNKLIIASQCDGETGTYVQSDDSDPYDNRYVGFAFDLDELFGDILSQHFTVSATTNMSGAGTVAGTGEYYPNQHCILTALANEGFTFYYWTNASGEIVSYNRSYGFTVTGDVTYQANFIENVGQYVSMLPENRNVIIEDFTGRNCGYCPDGHRIANEIANDYYGRVWPINVHAGGYAPTSYPNLNTPDGTTIHNGFSISGYPSGVINRSTSSAIDRYDWYDYTYYQIYEQAECNIAGAVDIDSISRIATITVEVYYTGSSNYAENYLTIAMLQDSIFGDQSDYGDYNPAQWVDGQYVHMHVLRDIITENGSAWGDPIAPTTQGSFITRTFTYEIPEIIGNPNGVEVDLNNIYFLAWVTENYEGTPTRPILNACKLQGEIPNPYHYEVDIHQYADNMNAIGIIQIDGVEQNTASLEIGAFNGDECRGRERAEYIPELDRYLLFLTLYGEEGDTIDFRLYDHSTNEELNLTCNTTVTFFTNDILGTPYDPFVFDFSSLYEITATVEPEETGTVTGTGSYSFGQTATLTAVAIEGYRFVNWTKDGEEVSTEVTYSFTVTEAAAFVAHFEVSDITQTSNFVTGWTWWSSSIETTPETDVLGQLKDGLGASGQVIKSQTQSTMHLGNNWVGTLTMNNELGYMVKASSDVTVEITGTETKPADHPITLNPGWTWIGYPNAETMTVAEALANHTPQANDVIKGQSASAMYMAGAWRGSLTLTPGIGYMYKSNNNDIITLTYASPTRMTEAETDNIEVHWNANYSAYPTNMTVLAAVELDGEELNSADYELAAFANGECRGSVPMMYVEPLDRYMALLTLSGEEATNLHFGLYNTETGEEYFNADETLSFEADAVIGEVDAPFVIRFRNTTGMDEWANSLQIYPNPVEHGQTISLGLSAEEMGVVQVDIINALGTVVETRRTTSLQTVTAPNVAGVYTLKITIEGKGTCYRKLVVR